jgi:hypothetical protein
MIMKKHELWRAATGWLCLLMLFGLVALPALPLILR